MSINIPVEVNLLLISLSALIEVIILALVVVALLRVWFFGGIFEAWRAYYQTLGGWLGELLSCPLCLSVHLSFILEILIMLPVKFYCSVVASAYISPLLVFAISGAAMTIWYAQHKDHLLKP